MKLQDKIEKIAEKHHDFYIWFDGQESWQEISSLSKSDLDIDYDDIECQFVKVELLLSDSRGVYIPNGFYNEFNFTQWHLNRDDCQDLNDFDSEYYWDIWQELLDNAYCILNNEKWILYQDGDLFAICYLEEKYE